MAQVRELTKTDGPIAENPYYVNYPEECNGNFTMTKEGMAEVAIHNSKLAEAGRIEFDKLISKTSYGVKNKLGRVRYYFVDNEVFGKEYILYFESRYIRNSYEHSFKNFSEGLRYYQELEAYMNLPDKIVGILKIMKLLGIPL